MSTQKAIRENNEKFMSAFRNQDPDAVARLYTSDGQALPPNGEVATGPAALAAFWKGAMEMGIQGARLETVELEELGDTAVEIGRFTLLAEGDRTLDSGKYIVVWKNQDGTWKLHRDIWNSSQPPAS